MEIFWCVRIFTVAMETQYWVLFLLLSVASGACVVSAAINKSLVSRNYWSQRDKNLATAFKSGDEGVKMTLPSLLV